MNFWSCQRAVKFAFAVVMHCAAGASAFADVNGGWLYRVEVEVEDQSNRERRKAGQQALETVLKRVTGLAQIEALPEIKAAFAASEQYYQQYTYSTRLIEGEERTLLNISFDAAEIAKLVRDTALPVWSANRPNIIAWVVVEKTESGNLANRGIYREILGTDPADDLMAAFRKIAKERGLPLIFPTMDLTDQMEVSTGLVWGQLSSQLKRASQRYEVDAMLMGRIIETPFGYRSEWNFALADSSLAYASEVNQYSDLATGAVDFVTRELAKRYAVLSGDGGLLRFSVLNVLGLADYSGLMSYLDTLEFVASVQVEQVQRNALVVAIETNSSWSQFTDLLALDGVLQSRGVYYAAQQKVLVWRGKHP